MTVRLSRQMRELLQTISSLCEAGVCDEEQHTSFSTAQRKALREMRRVPKLPVDQEKSLSALGEALDDYYKVGGLNDCMVADTSKPDDSFSANYARMTSPVFETFFDNLEKTVQERKDFGRF